MIRGVLGGLVGHRPGSFAEWIPEMSFRLKAQDVSPGALLLATAGRRGMRRPIDVAVLVHGLFVDEQNWTLGPDPIYRHLGRLFGWTPALVRFNTGLHVSKNGELLADLLEDLRAEWGPRLGRVHLVGHSMGGLVCRSALAALELRNSDVLDRIDRLFLLATPNNGADLERLGHAIEIGLELVLRLPARTLEVIAPPKADEQRHHLFEQGLRELRESVADRASTTAGAPIRGVQSLVALRSDGIRDVRFGYMQQREWEFEELLGDRFMINHRRKLPPPEHVRTYAIAGSLWPGVGSKPSRIRNDGLVSVASAASKAGEFDDLEVVEKGRFAEVPLLAHQLLPTSARVRARMRRWVDQGL